MRFDEAKHEKDKNSFVNSVANLPKFNIVSMLDDKTEAKPVPQVNK